MVTSTSFVWSNASYGSFDFAFQNIQLWMTDCTTVVIWVINIFLYSSSVYSFHLFLISSASIKALPFLSFIVPIITWNVPFISPIFLKRSVVQIPKMLMYTLVISCLTMSNLNWLMDLTFQLPMQYCYLQNWTLLSPPGTSTTEGHFCFGPASSFFLELSVIALCSSLVAYQTPYNLGSSSSSVISFCFFLLQWTTFCQNSSLWPVCLGSLARHGS